MIGVNERSSSLSSFSFSKLEIHTRLLQSLRIKALRLSKSDTEFGNSLISVPDKSRVRRPCIFEKNESAM
ncbi:hypothetical protein MIMGU_mgv1a017523mg [Erythranthe guttata]|uniref:Uncharacterized protein n=1 Tax=Erythranthe guttata TaxID=4155 RepID=A0A022Q8L3_ERYGU|nr:hypothetical protein MIMGU_mgv1a017523mg [Erythranthe guttata]